MHFNQIRAEHQISSIPFTIPRRRVKLGFMGLCNSSASCCCQLWACLHGGEGSQPRTQGCSRYPSDQRRRGEFSRQAWQVTSAVTSHPKSPRTTGNEAGGTPDRWGNVRRVTLLLCITKRDQINMRDYVKRRVTHQSGLPHLPGARHLHVNRPYTSSPDDVFSFFTSYLDLILLFDPILASHHKESDPVIQPFVCPNHLNFSHVVTYVVISS